MESVFINESPKTHENHQKLDCRLQNAARDKVIFWMISITPVIPPGISQKITQRHKHDQLVNSHDYNSKQSLIIADLIISWIMREKILNSYHYERKHPPRTKWTSEIVA